jgi:hypothetical protein
MGAIQPHHGLYTAIDLVFWKDGFRHFPDDVVQVDLPPTAY